MIHLFEKLLIKSKVNLSKLSLETVQFI